LPPAVNHVGNSLYNAYQAKDGKRLQFVMLETDGPGLISAKLAKQTTRKSLQIGQPCQALPEQ